MFNKEIYYRFTKNHGWQYVNVTEEINYDSIDGMKTIIPLNPSWKKVLIQVSGGLDSALLLYLVARTFHGRSLDIEIIPLTFDVKTKIKNPNSARKVINLIRNLTQYAFIRTGIEITIPVEHCSTANKNTFFIKTIRNIYDSIGFDFELNGNTLNPPENIRSKFYNDHYREKSRDLRTSIYNSSRSASPHAFNNKKGIIYLYEKENLLSTLAPLTLSCDQNSDKIKSKNLPVPCNICWWCYERRWGYESNGYTIS